MEIAIESDSESSATPSNPSRVLEELYRLASVDLHAMARQKMLAQPAGHTLQATALVNEAYLRLQGWGERIQDKQHLVQLAAKAMRQILVDYSRRKHAEKRPPEHRRVSAEGLLEQVEASFEQRSENLELLDEALGRLESRDPELARFVELHTFGGLTMEECAAHLGISKRTLERSWVVAQGILRVEIEEIVNETSSPPAGGHE